ncbi:CDP-alcohol phosphatidyltransferase family protein [Thioalbus denitrificans]|uniref:CDP-diacylglycerol--glycerol-3-phosphate 3-phosphatidyltransferase n=1 Tax=Thioalbus denitrificans TaxID=547122 RepID=A0A369CI57_9GAMM|nr:CDP-alcohol phosphatidyltransferase family protein [Thioalbus denitrificans]RCX32775.1 CDP-diacylglycerol--glycerol-3-phosphate 3-phosphatidyltransferase [Thioalbus denitrificans]
MPSVYDLKPRFQALLRPLVSRLASAGVSANQVTVVAIALSLGTGAIILSNPTSHWPLLLLPLALLLRMALNAIDGMLAREHGMVSALGGMLNELGDVVSDIALYLPLAFVPALSPALVVLVVLGSVVSEMTGVVGVQIGASRRYEGPMGKSDRALWLGAVGAVLGLGVDAAPWINGVLVVMVLLLGLTVVNRARGALGEVG